MKFNNVKVFNFEGALTGMRNPLDSWHRADSFFGITHIEDSSREEEMLDIWMEYLNKKREENEEPYLEDIDKQLEQETLSWILQNETLSSDNDYIDTAIVGPNDLNLAQRLIEAGPEHCKFLRQIFVTVDITAPLYWWKEFDTYKIGTTANSTSTMHTLAKHPITFDCFELADYNSSLDLVDDTKVDICVATLIEFLEQLRQKYLNTKDKRYWKELVRWLPNGWLQKRTITMSYANLRNIYFQRKDHKLSEWWSFCDWVRTLPYSNEFITFDFFKKI